VTGVTDQGPTPTSRQCEASEEENLMYLESFGSKMGCYLQIYSGRPISYISIYTVLALSYTAFIRKKQFFSECD